MFIFVATTSDDDSGTLRQDFSNHKQYFEFVDQIFSPLTIGTHTYVLAHRGASRAEQENTTLAFRRAADMEADGVELDARLTRDGVLVVHHDPVLSDGRVICELAHSDMPSYVPTLDEALDACIGMWVNVEIKNDPNEADFDPTDEVAVVVGHALLRRHEDARFLVSSFRRETIDKMRVVAPTLRTAWLTPAVQPDDVEEVLANLVAKGHVALHPWVGLLTRELIQACHAAGLQVNTWTCDDPERMAELIEWNVDGICTNVPDVAVQVLTRSTPIL